MVPVVERIHFNFRSAKSIYYKIMVPKNVDFEILHILASSILTL